jgi:hypothetical protein
VKRIAVLAAMMGALLLVFGLSDRSGLNAPPPAEAAETTTVFMYGNNADGTIGPIAPNTANESLLGLVIPPWCTNCYITRIEPDMVYWNDPNPALTNGMSANYNADTGQGIWLHHDNIVTNCIPGTIFLSGNERTVYQAPAGYGNYIGVPGSPDDPNFCNSQWFVGWHIHNASPTATHRVKVKFTVTYRTGETLNRLKGVSLNIATATDAEYTIPTGYSDTHTCPSNCGTGINTDYTVTAAQQGQIIAGGGHVHDYGFAVAAFNVTRNQWICTSSAGYGATSRYLPTGGPGTPGHPAAANAQTLDLDYRQPSTPDNAYHIQHMSTCSVSPAGSILCTGDVLRVHASYNNTSGFPIPDAMGILSLALPATPPDADADNVWDGCDTSDTDTDTFSDRVEFMTGTQANDACPDNLNDNAWPVDINNDRFSDITDITFLTGDFGLAVPPEEARHNIAPDPVDTFIDITDISRMVGKFGETCTP